MDTKRFRFDSFATEFACNDDKVVDDITDNDSGIGEIYIIDILFDVDWVKLKVVVFFLTKIN